MSDAFLIIINVIYSLHFTYIQNVVYKVVNEVLDY